MTGGDDAAGSDRRDRPEATGPTATGLTPRAAATLSYAAWWLTGALFLVIEPAHPYVRFHARQAVVALGLVWLLGVGAWAASLLLVFVSPVLFRTAAVVALITLAAGMGLWVVCLVQAWRGRAWAVPGLGIVTRRRIG